jgi:predicted phage terminase large subunit-like protein
LYQQRPAPEEGLYFKHRWFKRYRTLPEDLNFYMSFDPAVTGEETETDADSTAIQVWGVDTKARIYLIDEWVEQVTMDIWIGQLIAWGAIHKPLEIISESGVIRRAAEPFLKRAMVQAKKFFAFEWVTRSADKQAMARSAQAMASSGQVYVPENSVGDDFVDEMIRFPASKHDHRVDAFANFCLRLEMIWEAHPIVQDENKPLTIRDGSLKIKDLMPPRFPRKKSRWSHKRSRAL